MATTQADPLVAIIRRWRANSGNERRNAGLMADTAIRHKRFVRAEVWEEAAQELERAIVEADRE
jgi:hypothetical protein